MGSGQIGVAEQRLQRDRLRGALLACGQQVQISAQSVAADRQVGRPVQRTGLPGLLGCRARLLSWVIRRSSVARLLLRRCMSLRVSSTRAA